MDSHSFPRKKFDKSMDRFYQISPLPKSSMDYNPFLPFNEVGEFKTLEVIVRNRKFAIDFLPLHIELRTIIRESSHVLIRKG
jgi:hypothetical protein